LRRRRKRRRVRQERHESKRPGLPNISTRRRDPPVVARSRP
jgi:hypothetical protein